MPPLPDTGPGPGRIAPIARALAASLLRRIPLPAPSRTVAAAAAGPPLTPRQNNVVVTTSTVPAGYGAIASSPDPGTVVGITLGAVGGFVLVLYLIYVCMSFGAPPATSDTLGGSSSAYAPSVLTRRSRKIHKHRHGGGSKRTSTRRRSRATAIIVEEARSSPGSPPRAERIVVEERTTRRSVSRPRAVPPMPVPPPPRPVRSSSGSSSDDDDVVVIESVSPSRRRRSSQQRRSSGGGGPAPRRESGYRDIDPDEFAGGSRPMREVRRSRRDSRD